MTRAARKTVALRAGGSGFTPPNSPGSNPCLNCGTHVQLNYCPECGQRAIDPDPTLREFVQELAQEFLNWDGKLFATFRLLLTRPGELTQEYLSGRRARFISPLRLYLTCSVLFFFVSAVAPDPPVTIKRGNAVQTQIGPLTVVESDRGAIENYLDSASHSSDRITRAWGTQFGNALRHGGKLSAQLEAALPRAMFVLVPLFAVLVGLVFRRQRMRYPQHVAFALHVHAFMFVALLLTLAPRLSMHRAQSDALGVANGILVAISFASIAWYLVQAVRRVYATTLRGAIARSALIAGVYSVAFLSATVLIFVLVVLQGF